MTRVSIRFWHRQFSSRKVIRGPPKIVVGAAPWHRRLLVLDCDGAEETTEHGVPLLTPRTAAPAAGEKLSGIH